MKQDYLWDKQGADPEIEGFEDLLSGFAYSEMPAPIVIKEASIPFFRRLLDLKILVPLEVAGLALALGIAAWLYLGGGKTAEIKAVLAPTDNVGPTKTNPVPPKEPDQYFPVRTPYAVSTGRQQPQFIKASFKPAVKRTAKQTAPKLTKEEKFAYDQLMLALSITSSKLKIVQDAANGVDDATSPNLRNK